MTGGSYGRVGTSVEAGGQQGNLSGYITADALDDAGWREDSPSRLRRLYADLGARGEGTEFHLTFTGADNYFGAVAATPLQMLQQNWASVYTFPQSTNNQLAFVTASASWRPTDTLTYQAVAYYRHFQQAHVDGNTTDAQNTGCPDPSVLCFPNLDGSLSNLITTTGATVPATGLLGTAVLGALRCLRRNACGALSAISRGHDTESYLRHKTPRGSVLIPLETPGTPFSIAGLFRQRGQ